MKKFLLLFTITFLLLGCRKDDSIPITPPPPGPEVTKTGDFAVFSMPLKNEKINFNTVAFGRESKLNLKDYPKVSLTDNGYGHPSIIYAPDGFAGYKYWCALTPYFSVIFQQADYMAYENPHIFMSNDGVNWEEPSSKTNPLDVAWPGPIISYWSDPNLLLNDGKLYLYYRGNAFPSAYYGDRVYHHRAVVARETSDGINWSNRKLLYSTTTSKGLDRESMIVSPAFVKDNDKFVCYDVVYSTTTNPINSAGNQTTGFVMRRTDSSPTGNFGDYSENNICKFSNRPWGIENDPWHIDVCKYDSNFFMLICAGLVGKSNGDAIYLAYSKDGINFKVIEKPLFASDTYKSALVPISSDKDQVKFKLYRSVKTKGTIELYDLTLNKL